MLEFRKRINLKGGNMSLSLIPSSDEMVTVKAMAKSAVESQYFKQMGGEAGLLMIMLYARDLGIPLTQAIFGGMYNVQGKITISSNLMNNMIRKAGHKMEIIESTVKICTIKGTRKDTGEVSTCSFTIEEAKAANLIKNGGGWEKYPSDMLFARAMSRLARRMFADVIGNAYVEGEIPEEREKHQKVTQETKAIDVTPQIVDEKTGEVLIPQEERKCISAEQVKKFYTMTEEWPEYRDIAHKTCASMKDYPMDKYDLLLSHFEWWKEQRIAEQPKSRITDVITDISKLPSQNFAKEETKDDECPF